MSIVVSFYLFEILTEKMKLPVKYCKYSTVMYLIV